MQEKTTDRSPPVRATVAIRPACLAKPEAALYCALSESTLEKLVREGTFPAPRLLAGRRTGYLVRELDEWLESRPIADLLPPPNTGAPKPRPRKSQ